MLEIIENRKRGSKMEKKRRFGRAGCNNDAGEKVKKREEIEKRERKEDKRRFERDWNRERC